MKGILFKPDMIKAIADGGKTVTRRVLNLQPPPYCDSVERLKTSTYNFYQKADLDFHAYLKGKPRYRVGEIVYIKEIWEIEQIDGVMAEISYLADVYGHDTHDVYIADKRLPSNLARVQTPLFMPAWAARYFINITDVRPERLQEITFEDCVSEGIVHAKEWRDLNYKAPEPLHPEDLSNKEADKEIERGWIEYARQSYAKLWDFINPKYPWASNPWVWRYEFKRLEK